MLFGGLRLEVRKFFEIVINGLGLPRNASFIPAGTNI